MTATLLKFERCERSFIPDLVLARVLETPSDKAATLKEARGFSLKAARSGKISEPFDQEASFLHESLIGERAGQMTCYSAWALYIDLKMIT